MTGVQTCALRSAANREQITAACPADKFVSLLDSETDAEVLINLGAAIANIVHTDGTCHHLVND